MIKFILSVQIFVSVYISWKVLLLLFYKLKNLICTYININRNYKYVVVCNYLLIFSNMASNWHFLFKKIIISNYMWKLIRVLYLVFYFMCGSIHETIPFSLLCTRAVFGLRPKKTLSFLFMSWTLEIQKYTR